MKTALFASLPPVVCLLCLLCAGFFTSSALAGCYDEFVGSEHTIKLGDEFCLKNKKWNCKPLCLYYAGIPASGSFSIGVARQQGAMNLFIPFQGEGADTLFSLQEHSFKVMKLLPESVTLQYMGE